MPVPLLVWGAVAGAGALGLGGYQFGRQAGQGVAKAVPYVAGSVLVYMLLTKGK